MNNKLSSLIDPELQLFIKRVASIYYCKKKKKLKSFLLETHELKINTYQTSRHGKRWTIEEFELLRNAYSKTRNISFLMNCVPGRDICGIKNRIMR